MQGKTIKFKDRFGKDCTSKVRSVHKDRKSSKIIHVLAENSNGGWDEVPAGKFAVVK